jgi:hypothetical protein
VETKTEPEPEPQYDQYDELPAAPIMPSFAEEPAPPSSQPTPQPQSLTQSEPQQQARPQSQNQQPAQAANSSLAKPQSAAVRFVNFEHPSDDSEEE